jgi:hypothetical protein
MMVAAVVAALALQLAAASAAPQAIERSASVASWRPWKTDDGAAVHPLALVRTIHSGSSCGETPSKHCAGLQYVVQARSYPTSPRDLVTTMRGGGVAVWRWGAAGAANESALAVRSFVLPGVPTEGQDSLGDLLVVVALNRGVFTLDWPSMVVRGSVNVSVSGALHCKLWRDTSTNRTFALITTGLTHVSADEDYLVAVEVTDREHPVEVAKLNTPVHSTEGVLVLGDYAYVGGYVPNNKFVSVVLSGLTAKPAALQVHSSIGPRPEYDNMVGALANSSFRADEGGAAARPPLMYFGSYARPGGLLIFQSQLDGTLQREPVGKLLTQDTARANRVHIHPSNDYALLALEKGVAGTDTPPAGETGGLAVVDIRDPAAPALVARVASPERGGRVYTASWSPSGRFLVAFSAQNQTAFVYSFGAVAAVPFERFEDRALAAPALRPHMLPRPRGGTHEFTFSLYGAANGASGGTNDCINNHGCWQRITSGMRKLGVANGLDPMSFEPMALNAATWRSVAALGWPVSLGPLQQAACFQVPGCENNMTTMQYGRLAILDEANVYSEIQLGEWGNFMTLLRPAAECPWKNCSAFPAPGSAVAHSGNINWWHGQFPLELCNASKCDADHSKVVCRSRQNWTNTSLRCANSCCANAGRGNMTNDTRFQLAYIRSATPAVSESGVPLYGFGSMPASRREAYEYYREYYNERVRTITSVGDRPYAPLARVQSIVCQQHLSHYAALWNSQGPNNGATVNSALELQCLHANSAYAMARGGSRRSGKVWSVHPSGFGFGPTSDMSCANLSCIPAGSPQSFPRACTVEEMDGGATCSGAEATHSYSYYWRVWFHSWFAGAAKVTGEGPALGVFGCDSSGQIDQSYSTLSQHGLQAQALLRTARMHDRGTPLMPLAVIQDLHLGYLGQSEVVKESTNGSSRVPAFGFGNSFVGKSWHVFNMSENDAAFAHLLHHTLYKTTGLPDEELKTTPAGEIADIVLSDANGTHLGLYPALLLVGDQDWSNGRLAARLLEALQVGGSEELLLLQHHVNAMPPADWAALRATGKVQTLAPPAGTAITVEDLRAVAHRHLPVVVVNATLRGSGATVDILWQVNALPGGGFVVELSNEWGVEKMPCSPQRLSLRGAVVATLELRRASTCAVEWVTNHTLSRDALEAGSVLRVVVPPGNTSFIEFERA